MDFDGARTSIIHSLKNDLDIRLTYHNYLHTMDVYEASMRIAAAEQVPEKEAVLLGTAALFHDAGMLNGYRDHEYLSAELARQLLPLYDYTTDQIDLISELILATAMPQKPQTDLQKILCDADLDYLGTPCYFARSFNLKLEWELFTSQRYTLREWVDLQIGFLESHHYHTAVEQQLREPGKREHLISMKTILLPETPLPSQT